MKKFNLLIYLIFFIATVSAVCTESQIDINLASTIELDKLSGIGPVYAQAIVDTRPFSSVDDLIEVKGIGEATLEKIKLQNLACVETEKQRTNSKEEIKKESSQEEKVISIEEKIQVNTNENVINLNNDKEEEIVIYESKTEKINKNLLIGFFVFLLGIIFLLIKK